MTHPFGAAQVNVLRRLWEIWPDRPFCLIGGAAVACHTRHFWRVTEDLDITVSVALDELTARLQGERDFARHAKTEHRWTGPGGVLIDVIPAGSALLAAGELVWPESQTRMRLTGYHLAFERMRPLTIEPGLDIHVPDLATLGFLKMVSFLDQVERTNDLNDLSHLFDEYLSPDDDRRFSPDTYEPAGGYGQTSAYAFGWDLRQLLSETERAVVSAFLAKVRDERDAAGTQGRMAASGPVAWKGDPELLLKAVGAFERGFGIVRGLLDGVSWPDQRGHGSNRSR